MRTQVDYTDLYIVRSASHEDTRTVFVLLLIGSLQMSNGGLGNDDPVLIALGLAFVAGSCMAWKEIPPKRALILDRLTIAFLALTFDFIVNGSMRRLMHSHSIVAYITAAAIVACVVLQRIRRQN